MKIFPFLLLAVVVIFIAFSACKTPTYTSENLPEKQLYFGNGGGFAGLVTEYLLLENGQLFKVNAPGDLTEMNKVKKKTAAGIYQNYTEAGFDDLLFNQPGNIYYFIRMVNGENENYCSWSDQRPLPEEKMMDFYKNLTALIKED